MKFYGIWVGAEDTPERVHTLALPFPGLNVSFKFTPLFTSKAAALEYAATDPSYHVSTVQAVFG